MTAERDALPRGNTAIKQFAKGRALWALAAGGTAGEIGSWGDRPKETMTAKRGSGVCARTSFVLSGRVRRSGAPGQEWTQEARYRWSITTTWARVAGASGERVVAEVPVTIPRPTAQPKPRVA